jgi:hypothetical protein
VQLHVFNIDAQFMNVSPNILNFAGSSAQVDMPQTARMKTMRCGLKQYGSFL